MTGNLAVAFGVSADGRSVAEAEIADAAEGRALLAAAHAAGSDLAWAHSHADLSPLGFRRTWGYRRMTGHAAAGHLAAGHAAAGDPMALPGEIVPLPPGAESAGLWAAAFRGQWGHKAPDRWPLDLPPGTVTLALRRDGRTAGVCRVGPATGLVDAPGLVTEYRDLAGYASLLTAALAAVRVPSVTVESWGDGPDRVAACEALGLATAEYVPGWEMRLDG